MEKRSLIKNKPALIIAWLMVIVWLGSAYILQKNMQVETTISKKIMIPCVLLTALNVWLLYSVSLWNLLPIKILTMH
ncbi:MAG: hypothetical protein CO073_01575 [Candidatus Komeilibacteria bacterium CG_4_9_14_0_8_um_filter_36_9]|uniref:EamA domain-containing protein n=1 Tax=Candidatus Komeilibacteria bacterium CG_4_9_14_0_8_um_filter_36_9 TaxID=1974473 RepID=A0A2M8DRP2_9BACT|nr:MAG: hypothetical protein CO073_01575 [Candidatus Komeilibacteria bacterium CG_4_9_14_0_8_um_filter_36_9]